MDPRAWCTQARVLVVAGKGGVGKSTVAAAVALLAARCGVATLLVDVEGTSALPSLFGRIGPLSYAETTLVDAAATGGADLRARLLTSDDALVEYLDDHGLRRVSKRLAATGTLDVMATAIPGIRDILVLGKIRALETERAAELIVVDAPAAGHAVTFLSSARGLVDAVDVGPINNQAKAVAELISDPGRCEVLLVTLPEETPVNEAMDTAYLLEDRAGANLAPIVVNGVWPVLDLPTGTGAPPGVESAADFRRRRQELQAEQLARLSSGLPLTQMVLPYLFTTDLGLDELDVLVEELRSQVASLPEPV